MTPAEERRARFLISRHTRQREERELLKGRIRETKQWCPEFDAGVVVYRYDFAFKDPASGRYQQYATELWCADDELITEVRDERLVETYRVAIARLIQQKCGIREAIANQHQLALPRGVEARYV